MLRINLLPSELQKAARAPKLLFAGVVGGLVATTSFGVALFWLWINVRSLEEEVDRRTVETKIAQQKAAEVDRINEDIALYKDREQAIIEIRSRRNLWGPKLMQLIELTPDEIWITKIDMKTLDRSEYKWDVNKGPQTGGRLSLTCFAKGTDATTFTNYRAALGGGNHFYDGILLDDSAFPDNFFGDFMRFTSHSWNRVDLPDYAEPECLYSVIEMDLKPLYEKPQSGKKKKT